MKNLKKGILKNADGIVDLVALNIPNQIWSVFVSDCLAKLQWESKHCKDTEPLYHSFMYSLVSLLSRNYPLPVMQSLLVQSHNILLIENGLGGSYQLIEWALSWDFDIQTPVKIRVVFVKFVLFVQYRLLNTVYDFSHTE